MRHHAEEESAASLEGEAPEEEAAMASAEGTAAEGAPAETAPSPEDKAFNASSEAAAAIAIFEIDTAPAMAAAVQRLATFAVLAAAAAVAAVAWALAATFCARVARTDANHGYPVPTSSVAQRVSRI